MPTGRELLAAKRVANFWPTGPEVILGGTGHHYLTSDPMEPKLHEKKFSKFNLVSLPDLTFSSPFSMLMS